MHTNERSDVNAFKAWALALVLFFPPAHAWAAATLMGVVRENQLGGNVVRNVSVSAVGANPVKTGGDGQFVLHFPQHQPGEDVSIDVSRNGWVVVNDIQLKRQLPANTAQSPLEILIAKAAEREMWALQFYRLQGQHVVDAQYKRKLAGLEGSNTVGAEERERLLRERDQARALADELARQLATRPVGSGGSDYQKAASLFLEGRMDEALEILSEERLQRQMADARKLQEETVRNWLLRGYLLTVKFDFIAAARAYEKAVKFSPDSFFAWFAYSKFHQNQRHFKEAREGYGKALMLARASTSDENLAIILNDIGTLNQAENRLLEARQAYEEALKFLRVLAHKNPEVYMPLVAITLTNLGAAQRDGNRRNEARRAYEEALKILHDLAQKNPDIYLRVLIGTLNNLAVLNHDENRLAEARQMYEEMLQISRVLAQKNSNVYLPYVADGLRNLGGLQLQENRFIEARQSLEEALKISRTLAQKNLDAYLPDIASTLHDLGNLNRMEKRATEARQAFEEALKIRRALAQKNREAHLPDVAMTLNHLGIFRAENRISEARPAFEEALKIYRSLAQKNNAHLFYMATTLNNLGALNNLENRWTEALQAYEEALKILRTLAQKNADRYLPDMALTLNNVGAVHHMKKRRAEARQAYEEALKIYLSFARVAPAVYEPYVQKVQENLDALGHVKLGKPP
jgi:tetratricopeptide (TPR) repeat protein